MLPPIPVTAHTIVQIRDPFMFIFNVCCAVFMASITSVGIIVVIGMAKLAILIRTAMIEREGMLEAGRLPGIGGMACRTLTPKMISGAVAGMAGEAICGSSNLVIETGR